MATFWPKRSCKKKNSPTRTPGSTLRFSRTTSRLRPVQYQDDDSTAAGTDYVRSLDGGAWWYAPPEEDLVFELHGRIGTLANDVSKSYLEQVVFRVEAGKPARVLFGSAAALNEPLVGN